MADNSENGGKASVKEEWRNLGGEAKGRKAKRNWKKEKEERQTVREIGQRRYEAEGATGR